jgi:hypothetical protein
MSLARVLDQESCVVEFDPAAPREAGVEFMHGAARGWPKRDFLAWRFGSYHRATRRKCFLPSVVRLQSHPGDPPREPLEMLLLQARSHVIRTLERHLFVGGAPKFADDLQAKGLLARTRGPGGEAQWTPIDCERPLRDRVLSLFAADLLMRPEDYTSLVVCARCGHMSIGASITFPPLPEPRVRRRAERCDCRTRWHFCPATQCA